MTQDVDHIDMDRLASIIEMAEGHTLVTFMHPHDWVCSCGKSLPEVLLGLEGS